tara:strand:+ start:134 stop:694 length:561 start_codon:yes stop_codon:yes gene_type:complete
MARFNRIHNIYSQAAVNNNINNYPGVDININPNLTEEFIWNNLSLLYQNCINPILDEFGNSIRITSAYRSIELNTILGGNNNSQHLYGYAIDLISVSHSSSLLWNWCFENLPSWNQLIWEYPERGDFFELNTPFSWVHISYIKNNNPKLTSFSSKREDLHEMYKNQKTNKIGEYTHGITLADNNLI